MSSFTNSPQHFDDAQCSIAYLIAYDTEYHLPYKIKQTYPRLHVTQGGWSTEQVEEIISSIFDTIAELQVVCVNLQYRHHNEGKVDQSIKHELEHIRQNKKIIATRRLSIIELYKSLQCINYQIETEHLTSIRELTVEEQNAMTFLSVMIDDLAHHIVNGLDEYQSAKWSR